MPVNLAVPDPKSLLPVPGVALGVAEANIRKPDRKDLLVIRLDEGAKVAGVFTQNRFCAAPVVITRQHLSMLDPTASMRALVVNTGNANAGTGKDGLAQAIMTTDTLPKAGSRRIRVGPSTVTITGIAKGAGMIHPDMATLLGFVAT